MKIRSGYAVWPEETCSFHAHDLLRRTQRATTECSSPICIMCENIDHGKGKCSVVHRVTLNDTKDKTFKWGLVVIAFTIMFARHGRVRVITCGGYDAT